MRPVHGNSGSAEKDKIFVFRGDAGFEVGMGHLNRLATAARLVKENGVPAVVALGYTSEEIARSHILSGLDVIRLDRWLKTCEEPEFIDSLIGRKFPGMKKRLVISGYEFRNNSYFSSFRRFGWKTAFFDDMNLFAADCDILINANFFSSEMGYEKTYRGTGTRLLLGPEFYLLRAEFVEKSNIERRAGRRHGKKKILVTMGGSDFFNLTPKIVRELDGIDSDFSISVLAGATNRRIEALEKLLRAGLSHEAEIIRGVGDIAGIFSDCDIAVTSGGGTIYEMIYLEKPFVSFPLTANERLNAHSAEKIGLGFTVATNMLTAGTELENLRPHAGAKLKKYVRHLLDGPNYYKIKTAMAAMKKKYFDGSRLAIELSRM